MERAPDLPLESKSEALERIRGIAPDPTSDPKRRLRKVWMLSGLFGDISLVEALLLLR